MDCLICFGEASDMTTDCNHSFHQSCLDLWLDAHITCPYCRFELDESDYDYDYDYDSESPDSDSGSPHDELYDWCEGFEIGMDYTVEDSAESMQIVNKCYENIVYYSYLISLEI